MKESNKKAIKALIFDSGRFETSSYGRKAFETILSGSELRTNRHKIVISQGDIIDRRFVEDITPYLINGHTCDNSSKIQFTDYPYIILLEDVEETKAIALDQRLKMECQAYIGMTDIDVNSSDKRKQFWKGLSRDFSVEGECITVFGFADCGFAYQDIAEESKYAVHFDEFYEDCLREDSEELFSTRQSSFVSSIDDLRVKSGRNDSDRGLVEMNMALVREVELAGVEIWKAIEDIDKVYLHKNSSYTVIDYIFTSMYQAAQGIERLLKIVVEMISYEEGNGNKEITDTLLLSHNHMALKDYLVQKKILKIDKECSSLLEMLFEFYKSARYGRYSYSENETIEVQLIQCFGKNLKEERFDDEFKHLYGRTLGKTARSLYKVIGEASQRLNIYTFELNNYSTANFVLSDYYDKDLYKQYNLMKRAKAELLLFLIKEGNKISETWPEDIEALPFDNIGMYMKEIIGTNISETDLYFFVENQYEEMIADNKGKWINRVDFLDAWYKYLNTPIFDNEEEEGEMEEI